MAPTLVLSVAILTAVYLVYWRIAAFLARRRFRKFSDQHGCAEPPDAPGAMGFSRLWRMIKSVERGEDVLDDIFAQDTRDSHTVYVYGFEGTKMIETVEPANIQAVLATQFNDFELGKRRYEQFSPFVGKSIFSADGAFWEHSRAIFRPQFARENINDLEMTDLATRTLIEALGDLDSSGWTPGEELLPLLYNFTLDTASDFLFGESVDSQAYKLAVKRGYVEHDEVKRQHQQKAQAFSESFKLVNEYIITRIRLQSLYWLGDGLQFRRGIRKLHAFTDRYAKLAIESRGQAETKKKGGSLLERLATDIQDSVELRNQVTSLLLAGRDTTSAMLAWCFVRLALHPDVFQKLRKTILSEFPQKAELTFTKLKGCRYLQQFLQEILRLHPIVPLNQRQATRDTTLPTGGGADGKQPVAVEKGTLVLYSVYAMHRRKDLWGEDAFKFKPERWEQRIPAWQWLPFNGGPRICIGQQFALTEASFVLVRFLQHFDLVEPLDRDSLSKMKKEVMITTFPTDSRVRFHKAGA